MLILTIRSDKPEAELGLYDDQNQLEYIVWQAHRQLAETIHGKIAEILTSQNKTLHDIQGIVAYKGPGSFTGLRIGLSVANALSYSLQAPVLAQADDSWIANGIARLLSGDNELVAMPEYGALPNITTPKH